MDEKTFTVSGTARDDGREVVVSIAETRSGLELAGDDLIAASVEADAVEKSQLGVTPTGPFVVVSLDDPYSVLLSVAARLDPGYRLDGAVPRPSVEIPVSRAGVE